MLINHITEADYQKLLKAKENAGKVKEKVGYNKNPIVLPGNFGEGIDNMMRYSYSQMPSDRFMAPKTCEEAVWQYCNDGYDKTIYSSRNECIKGELAAKCEGVDGGSETNNMRKIFIALILLVVAMLIFYNPKKTA